jgi:hypothetical protein
MSTHTKKLLLAAVVFGALGALAVIYPVTVARGEDDQLPRCNDPEVIDTLTRVINGTRRNRHFGIELRRFEFFSDETGNKDTSYPHSIRTCLGTAYFKYSDDGTNAGTTIVQYESEWADLVVGGRSRVTTRP